MFAENDFTGTARSHLQAGLIPDQVRDPCALELLVDGRKVQGPQGFAFFLILPDLGFGLLLIEPLRLDRKIVGDGNKGRIILRLAKVVPGGKGVLEGAVLDFHQGIIVKQHANLIDEGIGVIDRDVTADQDDIRVMERKNRGFVAFNEAIKGTDRDGNEMGLRFDARNCDKWIWIAKTPVGFASTRLRRDNNRLSSLVSGSRTPPLA